MLGLVGDRDRRLGRGVAFGQLDEAGDRDPDRLAVLALAGRADREVILLIDLGQVP